MHDESILLRAEDAARQLNLSRSKVYAMLKRGELPCVRIGRSVRVPQDQLRTWLKDRWRGDATVTREIVDVEAVLSECGFGQLCAGVTALQLAPAILRFADRMKGINPLIRHIAREELVHRLTEVHVRTPAKMLALAFGDDD